MLVYYMHLRNNLNHTEELQNKIFWIYAYLKKHINNAEFDKEN